MPRIKTHRGFGERLRAVFLRLCLTVDDSKRIRTHRFNLLTQTSPGQFRRFSPVYLSFCCIYYGGQGVTLILGGILR
jgi:hypothetical protein